jgi:cyanophycinase
VRTRTLQPARAKLEGQRIDPRAADFKPYFTDAPFALDVLAPKVVMDRMVRIIDGIPTEALGLAFDASADAPPPRDLGFEFRFRRGPHALGWYDPVASADAYTLDDIRLEVVPVKVAQPLFNPWPR